ncbi:MAG: hypothetical protein LBL83_08095 [Clostridiales bacterium]|jgi:hypothetical protein|nr:hypothetical protein [Clostridiales bacterium]
MHSMSAASAAEIAFLAFPAFLLIPYYLRIFSVFRSFVLPLANGRWTFAVGCSAGCSPFAARRSAGCSPLSSVRHPASGIRHPFQAIDPLILFSLPPSLSIEYQPNSIEYQPNMLRRALPFRRFAHYARNGGPPRRKPSQAPAIKPSH